MKKLLLVLPLALLLSGCPPSGSSQSPEAIARDAIGGAYGFLGHEQNLNEAKCKADSTPAICGLINRGIAAQNTLADALVVYCSGTPAAGVVAYKDGGACVPVQSSISALQSAISNLNRIVSDIKTVVGSTAKTTWMRELDMMEKYLRRQS